MTTVICSEPVTIDLELSGAALQVQTDSLVVYTVEWRRWWQVWRPRCQSPGARWRSLRSHKVEEGSGR
jgi:hypothetical protein